MTDNKPDLNTPLNPASEGIEPGSLDTVADPYADFNELQLRSTLKAKDKEIERLKEAHKIKQTSLGTDIEHYKKKVSELESTVKMQLDTIGTQHDTLNAREKIVEVLRAEVENLNLDWWKKEVDNWKDEAGRLHAELEKITGPQSGGAKNAVNPSEVGDMLINELSQALERYGVRHAGTAQGDVQALTAVHFIQLAATVGAVHSWADLMQWLTTGEIH